MIKNLLFKLGISPTWPQSNQPLSLLPASISSNSNTSWQITEVDFKTAPTNAAIILALKGDDLPNIVMPSHTHPSGEDVLR